LRLKILKKLRTASLNSEFTGSYKKSVLYLLKDGSGKDLEGPRLRFGFSLHVIYFEKKYLKLVKYVKKFLLQLCVIHFLI